MEKDFAMALEGIRWFANVGKAIPQEADIRQIVEWGQWPGPENESVSEIALRQQSLYETLLEAAKAKDRFAEAEDLWNEIQDVVVGLASRNVPYDSEKDSWHAPTLAVWQAAWTAGLIGLFGLVGQKPPEDLETQWKWFREGHWPCALEEKAGHERLVVY